MLADSNFLLWWNSRAAWVTHPPWSEPIMQNSQWRIRDRALSQKNPWNPICQFFEGQRHGPKLGPKLHNTVHWVHYLDYVCAQGSEPPLWCEEMHAGVVTSTHLWVGAGVLLIEVPLHFGPAWCVRRLAKLRPCLLWASLSKSLNTGQHDCVSLQAIVLWVVNGNSGSLCPMDPGHSVNQSSSLERIPWIAFFLVLSVWSSVCHWVWWYIVG